MKPWPSHPYRRLAQAVALLVGVTLAGTLGYVWIAGFSLLDAVYMTVITLSTVGYQEVGAPLSSETRVFTVLLIVLGTASALYAVGAIAEFLIAGQLAGLLGRRSMERALEHLRDHVIVVGYGRFGRTVVEELQRDRVPLVVVECDRAREADLQRSETLCVLGSGLDDRVLEEAGIGRARALVTATGDEAVNVFITLSAREANPSLTIHARSETELGERRLRLAGASQVVSPYHLGGARIATAIVRPAVVDFIELAAPGREGSMDLEEVALGAGSPLAGLRPGDLAERGIRVSVVAIKRGDEPMIPNPAVDETFRARDRVVVIGDREELRRLAELAAEPGAP